MPKPHPQAAAYYAAFIETNNYAEVGRRFGVSRTHARSVIVRAGYAVPEQRLNTAQPSEKISTYFEWSVYKELVELSHATSMPISHHIREAVTEYLERRKGAHPDD